MKELRQLGSSSLLDDAVTQAIGSPLEKYRAGYDRIDWGRRKLGPQCVVCGCPVGAVGLCGECACEEDGA